MPQLLQCGHGAVWSLYERTVNNYSMKNPIATRHLLFCHSGGDTQHISVHIFKPTISADKRMHCCHYRISGISIEKDKYAVGADPVQALQLVMHMIGIDLAMFARDSGGSFYCCGETGTGFPEEYP